MGDDDHAHALARQLQHHVQHLAHHLRIQRRRDLVQQDHFRVHAQCPHDGNALLLTARQLARPGLLACQQPDPLQQSVRLGLGFRTVALLHLQRPQQDVVDDVHVGKELIALEHHAHLLAHLIPRHVAPEDAHARHADLATLDRFQAVDGAQQRALAAARRPQDHHHLAPMQRQIDAMQRHDIAIALVHAMQRQQCLAGLIARGLIARRGAMRFFLVPHPSRSPVPFLRPLIHVLRTLTLRVMHRPCVPPAVPSALRPSSPCHATQRRSSRAAHHDSGQHTRKYSRKISP